MPEQIRIGIADICALTIVTWRPCLLRGCAAGHHHQKELLEVPAGGYSAGLWRPQAKGRSQHVYLQLPQVKLGGAFFGSLRLDTSQMSLLLKADLSPSMTTGCSHSQPMFCLIDAAAHCASICSASILCETPEAATERVKFG